MPYPIRGIDSFAGVLCFLTSPANCVAVKQVDRMVSAYQVVVSKVTLYETKTEQPIWWVQADRIRDAFTKSPAGRRWRLREF